MKLRAVLTAITVFVVAATAARAQLDPFTNTTYKWLTFYHVTNISQTATYWNGPTLNWGWLSAYGGANDTNTMDRWRQITWDQDVILAGVRVQAWHQRTGGSIGDYRVEYSPDGYTGWTNVPTATVFSGGTDYNVTFDSNVVARSARVFFPSNNYSMGSGGNGGPGVYNLWFRGNTVAGIDPTDTAFSLLAAPGYQGVNPVITAGGRAFSTGSGPAMMDGQILGDSGRTGWLTPLAGGTTSTSEFFRVDLGPSPERDTHLWRIKQVRIYAGSFYYYMPTAIYTQLSPDGSTWGTNIPMPSVSGVYQSSPDVNQMARYLRVLCDPDSSHHWLPHELAINAYAPPPPVGTTILAR